MYIINILAYFNVVYTITLFLIASLYQKTKKNELVVSASLLLSVCFLYHFPQQDRTEANVSYYGDGALEIKLPAKLPIIRIEVLVGNFAGSFYFSFHLVRGFN